MTAPFPFISKEWLLEDPKSSIENVQRMLNNESSALSTAYASIFSKRLMISLVYISNEIERTLSSGTEEREIYKYLDDVFDSIDALGCLLPAAEKWNAEGKYAGETKFTKVQLLQHMRSLKFLFSGLASRMTVNGCLQAHGILMNGAVDEKKMPVAAGVFRDHPCHAGNHAYPEGDPVVLERSLQRMLDEFNDAAAASDGTVLTKLQASTKLFYDVITLHPFQNGNGRLCRIIFAFAMAKMGFPFPVQLTTGHKSARKHYMKAILLSRRGDMRELNTTALMSLEYGLCNFLENVRLAK